MNKIITKKWVIEKKIKEYISMAIKDYNIFDN